MNYGAFVYQKQLLSPDEVAQLTDMANTRAHEKESVHTGGRYAALQWFQVDLDRRHPLVRKVLDTLGVQEPGLCVFYYLEPGAVIHPHRDLTGAGLNNRIRFHVPIVTNDRVEFIVDGKRERMAPGDLWCLDTSYMHQVKNNGDATRVHIVIECYVTPQIRARLPNTIGTKVHTAQFAGIMAAKFAQSVLVNSWKDPRYFVSQMDLVRRFFMWRVLGVNRLK